MPYIPEEAKVDLAMNGEAATPGELNFLLTVECLRYMEMQGLNYQTINDILGALEGAKQEFYRRVAVPYENMKAYQNGDIYEDVFGEGPTGEQDNA